MFRCTCEDLLEEAAKNMGRRRRPLVIGKTIALLSLEPTSTITATSGNKVIIHQQNLSLISRPPFSTLMHDENTLEISTWAHLLLSE